MKIKYYHALLAYALLIFFTSCNKIGVKGEGPITTQPVNVSGFTNISVSSNTGVHIVRGDHFSVVKKGYTNQLSYLDTEVKGTTLEIGFKDAQSIRNNNTEVFITMPSLSGITINGNTHVDVIGNFTGLLLNMNVNGNGELSISEGAMDEIRAAINGNGVINAFGIKANIARYAINGNGKIETTVSGELDVTIYGNGNVFYKGNPTSISSQVFGSGKLVRI